MLETFLIAAAIASTLTAAFTFRFRMWSQPIFVAGYFATFLALEYVAKAVFLPEGFLGLEVLYLCLPLIGVYMLAIAAARRAERTARPEAGGEVEHEHGQERGSGEVRP